MYFLQLHVNKYVLVLHICSWKRFFHRIFIHKVFHKLDTQRRDEKFSRKLILRFQNAVVYIQASQKSRVPALTPCAISCGMKFSFSYKNVTNIFILENTLEEAQSILSLQQ